MSKNYVSKYCSLSVRNPTLLKNKITSIKIRNPKEINSIRERNAGAV